MRYGQIMEPTATPGVVRVIGQCQVTRRTYSIEAPIAGLDAWQRGALIQDALPDLTKEQREFLVSGTSPEGWAQLFGADYLEAIGANPDGTDKDESEPPPTSEYYRDAATQTGMYDIGDC